MASFIAIKRNIAYCCQLFYRVFEGKNLELHKGVFFLQGYCTVKQV